MRDCGRLCCAAVCSLFLRKSHVHPWCWGVLWGIEGPKELFTNVGYIYPHEK